MPTIEDQIISLETQYNQLLQRFSELEKIYNLVLSNVNYIHPQVDINLEDNIIKIKADRAITSSRNILYVLPIEALEPTVLAPAILRIIFPDNNHYDYNIKKETLTGNIEDITIGDILANKLAMFRFSTITGNEVILINSNMYGDLQVNSLTVSGDINCYGNVKAKLDMSTDQNKECVNEEDINSLRAEFDEKYQSKIQFGTASPEHIFASDQSIPDGTVYIQLVNE